MFISTPYHHGSEGKKLKGAEIVSAPFVLFVEAYRPRRPALRPPLPPLLERPPKLLRWPECERPWPALELPLEWCGADWCPCVGSEDESSAFFQERVSICRSCEMSLFLKSTGLLRSS